MIPFLTAILLLAAGPDPATERELRHLKEVLWPQAYREADVALLERILGDEFTLIAADGSWTDKATELAELPGYDWQHEWFRYDIRRLTVHGGVVAIIAGEGRAGGTRADGPYCLRYQSSNVLERRDGRWQATLSQVSGVTTECAGDQR